MSNLFIRTLNTSVATIMYFNESTGETTYGKVTTNDNRYDLVRKLRKDEVKSMTSVDAPCTCRVCGIVSYVTTKETRGMYESEFIENSDVFQTRKDIPAEYAFSKEYKGLMIEFDRLNPTTYAFDTVKLFVSKESEIDKVKAGYMKESGLVLLKEVSRETVSSFRAMTMEKFMTVSRKMKDNFRFADTDTVVELDEK